MALMLSGADSRREVRSWKKENDVFFVF